MKTPDSISSNRNKDYANQAIKFAQQFKQEMSEKTDRAIIVLSAIYLNNSLTNVLQKYLVTNTHDREDNLFMNNRPLFFLGAKIDLVQRIGLVSMRLWADMDYVRKMRDDAAHKVSGYKLNADKVEHFSNKFIEHMPKYRKEYFPKDIQGDFLLPVELMIFYLDILGQSFEESTLEGTILEKLPQMKPLFVVTSKYVWKIPKPVEEWIYDPDRLNHFDSLVK